MILLHYFMCLAQILYTTYNLVKWYLLRATMWVRANWKYRERFIESYHPSTEKVRELEMSYKNAAGLFQYELKRNMVDRKKDL